MSRFHHIFTVTRQVKYPGFAFPIACKGGDHWVRCEEIAARCNRTGEPMVSKGRWWRVSSHATDSEIVWTCFKAVLTYLEHEARELFTFMGQPIADSHVDVYKLARFMADPDNHDARQEEG